jgi:hypothetical protein
MLLAYFGPETFLPLTSVLAAVAGVGLMLGRNTLTLLFWPIRRILSRGAGAPKGDEPGKRVPPPHFPVQGSALDRRRAARGTHSGDD